MLKKTKDTHESNKLLLILIIMFGVVFCGKAIISANKKMNDKFNLREDTLTYDNLPSAFDGYRILQLSDLHSKEFGKNNENLIDAVNKINPHVIMVTGDMFSVTDLKINCDETKLVSFKLLSELAKNHKIIYVLGNHEEGKNEVYNGKYWSHRDRNKDNSFNRYVNKLENLGVIFVNNDVYKLSINNSKNSPHINVYGVYYNSIEYNDKYVQHLRGNTNEFDIILCHDPKGFDILDNRNFNLMLSGHTHGGVIRLPFIGGLLDPDRKLFPTYDKGIYGNDGYYMNVSTGLGEAAIPRFNNKPEINLITLSKTK